MEREKKIPIRQQGKPTEYVLPSTIELVEAGRAYCTVHFTNKNAKVLSMSMHEFLLLLPCFLFCTVHRSYCVNIDEIGFYDNHHFLTLKSGTAIPVSKKGKEALLKMGFIL